MGLAAAVLGAGAMGLAGAAIASSSAKSAAHQQVQAENHASDIMQQNQEQIRADLSPFAEAGRKATTDIQNLSPFSFNPTQQQLEATPGYQFNLSQGLKSTQNSYAGRGLGTSGAAMKGAATYASGLADTTYQNQFSNALATYNQNLARLQGLSATGESAAAQTGAFGTTTAQSIGQTAVGAANASASGTIGTANAITGGFNAVGGAGLNAYMLNRFFSPSGAVPSSMYTNLGAGVTGGAAGLTGGG